MSCSCCEQEEGQGYCELCPEPDPFVVPPMLGDEPVFLSDRDPGDNPDLAREADEQFGSGKETA